MAQEKNPPGIASGSQRTPQRSMTGYAAASVQQAGFTLGVTLRSVNHRYLDLRTRFPELLLPLEREARSAVQGRHARGHVDLNVSLEFTGGSELHVDESLAGKYVEIFQRLGTRYGLAAPIDAAALSQLPGVIQRNGSSETASLTPEIEAAFRAVLTDALEQWDHMRADEAALLTGDLSQRIAFVAGATEQVEQALPRVLAQAKTKSFERVNALVGQPGLDPARLAQEALLLMDRTDPTEEIQRLKVHVKRFTELLHQEADSGRKLDFLLQEMHREANTLLVKVAGLGTPGLALTGQGLQIKTEIEKLREQVQNLQ